MNKSRLEIELNKESLTPLELFKRVRRSEEADEYLTALKRMMSCAIREELSPRQKECIILYYVYGMKQREIADKLQLNPSVVSRHISRGLRRLQRVLKYGCFF